MRDIFTTTLNWEYDMINKIKFFIIAEIISILVIFRKIETARYFLNKYRKKSAYNKTMYVDMSVISVNDAGTGIQRMAKSIRSRLENYNFDIYDVKATRKKKYRLLKDNQNINFKEGDIFLGLDWSADFIIKHKKQLIMASLKGVRLDFIVNDILAVSHPEWFTRKTYNKLNKWLMTIIAISDNLICVSNTVKNDVNSYLNLIINTDNKPKLHYITLGGELAVPNQSLLENQTTSFIQSNNDYLIKVSTIEPRKGHIYIIELFTKLWDQGLKTPLLLVGKLGWNYEEITHAIMTNKYYNKQLFWFNNVDDHNLFFLYKNALGVINSSDGEGFGLPLTEAAFFKKPLFVNDLEIFREVTQGKAFFFSKKDSLDFNTLLFNQWHENVKIGNVDLMKINSWDKTVEKLILILRAE